MDQIFSCFIDSPIQSLFGLENEMWLHSQNETVYLDHTTKVFCSKRKENSVHCAIEALNEEVGVVKCEDQNSHDLQFQTIILIQVNSMLLWSEKGCIQPSN